jgi:two-component system, NarL family, nitrate/nitrite response regulator NarL
MPNQPIKVLIADDHQMFIEGIKALLKGIKDIEVMAEANNGKQIVEQLSRHNIDVVLTDVQMPEMTGIEATQVISEKFPKVKVIALTMFNESGYVSRMLRAGASGYILKNADKKELINAIQQVAKGENYYSPEITLRLIDKMKGKKEKSISVVQLDELSEREKEILKLIAQENTNAEIAEKIFLSPLTVNTHRKNLIRKLGVKNTAGLVRYAVENGLL